MVWYLVLKLIKNISIYKFYVGIASVENILTYGGVALSIVSRISKI